MPATRWPCAVPPGVMVLGGCTPPGPSSWPIESSGMSRGGPPPPGGRAPPLPAPLGSLGPPMCSRWLPRGAPGLPVYSHPLVGRRLGLGRHLPPSGRSGPGAIASSPPSGPPSGPSEHATRPARSFVCGQQLDAPSGDAPRSHGALVRGRGLASASRPAGWPPAWLDRRTARRPDYYPRAG